MTGRPNVVGDEGTPINAIGIKFYFKLDVVHVPYRGKETPHLLTPAY